MQQSRVQGVAGPSVEVERRSVLAGPVMRFAWLRYPDFWLAVALAAFLRLWHIDMSQFLDDQTYLMQLARGAFLHGAIPVTGIPSSIGTLNPPLSVYLLIPFTLFTANPLPIVIFIALWNVAGVALCYAFTLRYFGRWAAASASLLFATCGFAINYSRFLWQQNYLPPVLALWALTLYLGCVRGRSSRWFIPHVLLLLAAGLLHPTALLLAPVTLAGLLLAPASARPPLRDYLIAAGIGVLLFVPTLVWQLVNGGADVRVLAHYFTRASRTNLDVLAMLNAALSTPSPTDFGPALPYAALGRWYPLLSAGTTVFFALGLLVLTVRVLAPVRAAWRTHATTMDARPIGRLRVGALGLWQGLRADAAWRINLLLWLMALVPIVLMIRHSAALTVHYLMVLYPTAFIVGGVAVQASVDWARRQLTAKGARRTLARIAPTVVVTLLVLVVAVQATLWTLYPASLAAGTFDAFRGYGYPLGDVLQADESLSRLQRQYNASTVAISLPTDLRYRTPLDYLLVSEHASRIDFTNNCLVLPAAQSGSTLLVTTQPAGPANDLAAGLPNTRHVADVQVPGGSPWAVYSLTGATPPLADEHAVTPVDFADAAGNGLRLEAISTAQPGLVRLRWTVLGSADQPSGTPWYRIQPSALPDANGQPVPVTRTECQPTHWQAGETVFTWVSFAAPQTPAITLLVRGGTSSPRLTSLGPVRLLAGRVGGKGLQTLPPSAGQKTADGGLVLPLGVIGLP